MSETEQNKTEEATPFKLKRARQEGMLARGMDLGFAASLAGFLGFLLVFAEASLHTLSTIATRDLAAISSIDAAQLPLFMRKSLEAIAQPILLLLATMLTIVVFFEIVQNRGIVFSVKPLKPNFSRLNPAKNLKRIFSARMLKETLKSVFKLALYSAVTAAILISAHLSFAGSDAEGLVADIERHGIRLLSFFLLVAIVFAAIDQVLARADFRKQMRMSRSELTREVKDRDGDPRLRQKRKRLHTEFSKQVKNLRGMNGADMLIVNPHHYAVALRYTTGEMSAPIVTAKGRNRFALLLKKRARAQNIMIFERPPLARALFRECDPGTEIGSAHYRPVADLYREIRNTAKPAAKDSHADA